MIWLAAASRVFTCRLNCVVSRFYFMPLSGTPIVAKYFRVRKVTTNTGNVGMSEFQMRCDEAHLYLTTTSHVRCTSPYCKITIETEIPNSLTVIEGHVQVPTPPNAT